MSQLTKLLPYLVFPFTLLSGLAFTSLIGEKIHSPITAAIYVSIAAIIWVALLERLMPYRKDWNQSRGDVVTDFWHTVINQMFLSRGLTFAWNITLVGVIAWLSQRFGNTLWPDQWPLLVQLAFMLLIAEFGRYWLHRFSHRNKWLWRLHAVHHSPSRLYFLNAGRVHPLEKFMYIIPEAVPFILLGTNVECLAAYATFNSIHGLFQHGNVKVKLGPLNYFFSMAELHRWHHSKIVAESDNNFGNNLSVWDWVFGTWFLPKDREVGPLGLLAPDYPGTYIEQFRAPFQHRDISQPLIGTLEKSGTPS